MIYELENIRCACNIKPTLGSTVDHVVHWENLIIFGDVFKLEKQPNGNLIFGWAIMLHFTLKKKKKKKDSSYISPLCSQTAFPKLLLNLKPQFISILLISLTRLIQLSSDSCHSNICRHRSSHVCC